MPLRAVKRRRAAPREARPGFRAVGLVLKPRGLRGELKAQSLTDFPERFDPGATLHIGEASYEILTSQWDGGAVFLTLEGVDDREAAEALRGALIEVPETDRVDLEPGEYYLDEIEGCAVVDEGGATIGVVREVLQPGANDVYVVAREDKADLLVPAIPDVVVEIRIEEQTIVVDVPPGLDPEER